MSPSVQSVNQGWNGLVSMDWASGVVEKKDWFLYWNLAAWFPSMLMGAMGPSPGDNG